MKSRGIILSIFVLVFIFIAAPTTPTTRARQDDRRCAEVAQEALEREQMKQTAAEQFRATGDPATLRGWDPAVAVTIEKQLAGMDKDKQDAAIKQLTAGIDVADKALPYIVAAGRTNPEQAAAMWPEFINDLKRVGLAIPPGMEVYNQDAMTSILKAKEDVKTAVARIGAESRLQAAQLGYAGRMGAAQLGYEGKLLGGTGTGGAAGGSTSGGVLKFAAWADLERRAGRTPTTAGYNEYVVNITGRISGAKEGGKEGAKQLTDDEITKLVQKELESDFTYTVEQDPAVKQRKFKETFDRIKNTLYPTATTGQSVRPAPQPGGGGIGRGPAAAGAATPPSPGMVQVEKQDGTKTWVTEEQAAKIREYYGKQGAK